MKGWNSVRLADAIVDSSVAASVEGHERGLRPARPKRQLGSDVLSPDVELEVEL
jgi:hypothetical protein